MGEVAELMKRGARAAGRDPETMEIILNEVEAVEIALRQARKDDLIVVIADNIKRTFEQVVKFRDKQAAGVAV